MVSAAHEEKSSLCQGIVEGKIEGQKIVHVVFKIPSNREF